MELEQNRECKYYRNDVAILVLARSPARRCTDYAQSFFVELFVYSSQDSDVGNLALFSYGELQCNPALNLRLTAFLRIFKVCSHPLRELIGIAAVECRLLTQMLERYRLLYFCRLVVCLLFCDYLYCPVRLNVPFGVCRKGCYLFACRLLSVNVDIWNRFLLVCLYPLRAAAWHTAHSLALHVQNRL